MSAITASLKYSHDKYFGIDLLVTFLCIFYTYVNLNEISNTY